MWASKRRFEFGRHGPAEKKQVRAAVVFGIIPECRSSSLRNERPDSPEFPVFKDRATSLTWPGLDVQDSHRLLVVFNVLHRFDHLVFTSNYIAIWPSF